MSRNPKNVPAKSKSPLPFVIIGVVLVAVTAAVLLMSRQSASNGPPAQNTGTSPTQRMPVQPGASNPYTRGMPTARVTVEEFSDFQCPACGALEPGLRRVMKDYDSRVNFVFRNFPLQMHKYAFLAARAAEAAGQQGKFWEMHDLLYDNQKEWSDAMEPRVQFDSYATRIGLDMQKFKADMERQDLAERIKSDLLRGNSLGVKGTPTVYLNGRELVPGKLVTEDDLRHEIDAALK
ncbi:MAG: thioredoxin domain-containing protein [Acidobacteria bacterium]|nr:thioredoxin domain-containing protein [Acidobacteriota bacterium]